MYKKKGLKIMCVNIIINVARFKSITDCVQGPHHVNIRHGLFFCFSKDKTVRNCKKEFFLAARCDGAVTATTELSFNYITSLTINTSSVSTSTF